MNCDSRLIFGRFVLIQKHGPDCLRDDQWERLEPLVPGGAKGRRGPRSNNRLFIDAAALWMARSGARWRDLPERFGPYGRTKRRYYRWVENEVIDRIFLTLSEEADLEWLQIDATIGYYCAGPDGPLRPGAQKPRPPQA